MVKAGLLHNWKKQVPFCRTQTVLPGGAASVFSFLVPHLYKRPVFLLDKDKTSQHPFRLQFNEVVKVARLTG